ncbi:TetR/AcrR family transcriptional regulator [Zavarzinia compransoris]|uniref:TetR family transcriptional regulator n=1 Tax=Zavarzinia compransoris TaxID=1264899 RepID=A0A317DT38_9PROT|nr:TetR/AcrR family transcriptional regulator [Zavarzinia compransoris]PWR17841.1 TetR family transcriptional regulator [Zavarzinia compransoris]TDP49376.1 TetR family transcriptional regulator [Zavarzinia compransoris]
MGTDSGQGARASAGPARRRGPSPEKTARTRAQVVQAAMAEFLDQGYSAATMAGVARRAGLAKGTLYLYFPTKEALFAGIVRDIVTNPLQEAEAQAIGAEETVADYFRRTLVPVMRRIESSGRAAVARLILAEGARFPVLAEVYREEVFHPLVDHIRLHAARAIARGEPGGEILARHPHLLIAPLWVGMVNNGVIAPDRPLDIGAMFEASLDLIFR